MKEPIRCERLPDHNTTKLFFEDETEEEYYVKGSIVWPEKFYHGYMLIAGQDLINSCVWVFKQHAFLGVDYDLTVRDSENRIIDIQDRGLVKAFNTARELYGCTNFFHYSDQEVHKHWRKQVYRELLIDKPSPRFIKVKPPEKHDGQDNLIVSYNRREKLRVERESPLFNQLGSLNDPEDLANKVRTFPESAQSINALRCLLLGFEKMPWRMPLSEEEQNLY